MASVTIGPDALSPATRRGIDRDAWLLGSWWIVVGAVASMRPHRVAGIRSPRWRYPLTGALMDVLGGVVGLRARIAVFARSVRAALGAGASRSGTGASGAAICLVRHSVRRRARGAITVPGLVVDLVDAGYRNVVVGALLAMVGLVTSRMPVALSPPVAMAELALGFIVGRGVDRDVLPPRPERESLSMTVGWPRGVAPVVLGAAAGATFAIVQPGAESLADVFRWIADVSW